MAVKLPVDRYTLRARIQPLLLACFPLAVTAMLLVPRGVSLASAVWGLAVWSGGALMMAQFTREMGRRREAELFAKWDGMPTTRMLRLREAVNLVDLTRRHAVLQRLVPDVRIPQLPDELADPTKADEVYDVVVGVLREKTRDHQQFPLVFEENCNYGFRRNCWVLCPLGIASSVIALGLSLGIALSRWKTGEPVAVAMLAAAGVDLISLAMWSVWVNEDWVRAGAEAYAVRLLASSDAL